MQVQIPASRVPVFFFFHRFFLPFGFLLSSLTAGPVSFARFLRKRISSITFNSGIFIITFIILRSTPIVKIEDATSIQRCDGKRRFIAAKTSALKQLRDIQMFC